MPHVIAKLHYYPPKSNNPNLARRRNFYSSNQTNDYMGYIDKGGKEVCDYIDYAGDKDKSSGVFNKDGLLSKEQKKELRKRLRDTQSVIWDLVISFEELYGNYHLKDFNDARNLLNAKLSRFFKQAGLNPANVTWFAGMHENTDNRHLHVSFFENEPQSFRQKDRTRKYYHNGNISKRAFDGLKLSVEAFFSDTATKAKERRKQIMSIAQDVIQNESDYNRVLCRQFIELYELIPADGHIGYASSNMTLASAKADEITSYILRNNPRLNSEYKAFKNVLAERDNAIRLSAENQKIHNVDEYLIKEKTIDDLYRRLGNKVIQRALQIKKEERAKNRISKYKRYRKKTFIFLLEESARLNALYEQECMDSFREFMEKLDEAEYKHSKEEMQM